MRFLMSLTPTEMDQVVHLARLELTPAELETMTRQIRSIVEYVDLLRQVDTEGVEPLAHALAVSNVFREDELKPSLPVDEALANAPDPRTNNRGERFYAVPAVLR
jgi:aspartyl-tRNA(Asn)/glutamyl-tRNA(Gln) amidotransferase subunit C